MYFFNVLGIEYAILNPYLLDIDAKLSDSVDIRDTKIFFLCSIIWIVLIFQITKRALVD